MRKLVVSMFLTLDGVMEAPDQWHGAYFDDEMGATVGAQMAASDALLLGRVTYEGFAAAWPNMADEPGADHMNGSAKYVVSTTLDKAEWNNSTVLSGNLADEVNRLKQQPGKNITVMGSATLIQSLMREDLIDEYQLLIDPVIIGSGKRLFQDGLDHKALTLVDSKTFSTGVLYLTYRPAHQA
ncbi:dihydrofolate reductase family protein [Streptomyces sp. H10-C2]|uniref:dihydrofolate reductase family protein n=1 Tax=unclassified Streptomyces TaxID=2593676 RepID=UPI0024B9A7C8|nr:MULTISPECIES: dihydrofolate reductase family protein [unclassified Streptomyces]MDJ0341904.1 dihydrofolate reductase family protein [Streptomyces sp. PH10-H1]MDJ0370342.1 dihydrofolate reductase family protein [Streptomyces sp. H10-C2]